MVTSRDRVRGSSSVTALVLLIAAGLGACRHGQPRESVSTGMSPGDGGATVLERDEITVAGAASVIELIEGRLSGVRVVRGRGGVWFEIRGPGTFGSSPEALVVVDGVQSSARALLAMSPDDVARIQVFKGAAAGRYGIRGANGALVITTRRQR